MRKKYQKTSMYKGGGQTKQEWISNKISLLIKEGKNQDQAVAQAISMADSMFQQGGGFSYNKQQGDALTSKDIQRVNENPYFTLEEDFARAWLSKETPAPVTQPLRPNYNQMPIVDITSDGQWTNRKVWRTQKPEWFVGKREPIEGQDFTIVPYSQWSQYQNSPEYLKYSNRDERIVDEFKEGGELPQYQTAGVTTNMAWQNAPSTNNVYPGIAPQNQNLFFQQQPTAQQWSQNVASQSQVGTTQPPAVAPPVVAQNPTPVASSARPQIQPIDSPLTPMGLSYGTPAEQLQTSAARTVASIPTQQQKQVDTTPQPFQFINPGGVSIETAANIFGQGLANKNPFDIITGGLKVATGLGRNILAPYASNVANNRVNARAAEDMRDSITRTVNSQILTDQGWNEGLGYYQEGGEMQQEQMLMQVAQALQQGATPEEVMQQLIASGLDEQTAAQMIEMVMQELQAQAPPAEEQPMMQEGGTLDTLKGKRILDYKLNPSTGKYTVTYED